MSQLPDKSNIDAQAALALAEDVSNGDLTARLIDAQHQSTAKVICREAVIVCGIAWFDAVFRQLDQSVAIKWHCREGEQMSIGQTLCTLRGGSRAILTGERTALNFLQTLSATATTTKRFVDLIAHTPAKLLDTRKTIPGLRLAQKYAVSCGGGYNHRIGLFDAFLIKENHIMAVGSIAEACAQARRINPHCLLEVEVESFDELSQAINAEVDRIMLDNFSVDDICQAVEINRRRVELEVSGNVSASTLCAIAETGVDYISVGALTKHIQAVDLSMRLHD